MQRLLCALGMILTIAAIFVPTVLLTAAFFWLLMAKRARQINEERSRLEERERAREERERIRAKRERAGQIAAWRGL